MAPERVPSVGCVRVWYPRVGSTMDVAMELAGAGAPHGTLVEAAEQTAGRGRHGRTWLAPAGSAFLGSWLLRVPPGIDLAGLSPSVASAVLRTVETLASGVPAQFKWPNDVLIDGRKVAGILLTSRTTSEGAVVVAGTGLNVRTDSVPAGVEATCLAEWAVVTIGEVRERLVVEFDAVWGAVTDSGGLPQRDRRLLEARMAWRGEPVEVLLPGGAVEGVATGLALDGGLRLRSLDGRSERVLHVGEIARGPRQAARAVPESTVYLPEQNRS